MTDHPTTGRFCVGGEHVGPIYRHLVTTTRIEVDLYTLAIKDDAEAEILEQVPDGFECEACGSFTGNPFHLVKEETNG